MSSHLVFNGVDEAEKGRLEAYWAKKVPRLKRLLVTYSPELQEVRLTVSYHKEKAHHSFYEVRGVVQLPTGTVAAHADDRNPEAALDRVADDLAKEIKRHKELVRKDYLYKRKNRQREEVIAAGPQLQQDRESDSKEAFFKRLRPLLRFLGDHARRELRGLELKGLLHKGELEVGDVLDQVLAMAWERFNERPRKMPLDVWLTDLLHEYLEQYIKQEPRHHVSLQEPAEKAAPDRVERPDEQEWWADVLGDEEKLMLQDVIPDAEGTESWDRLLRLLNELPEKQRQAFVLHVVEDYAPFEIAMLQDRSEDEVKKDIEAARQTLRKRLLEEGHVAGESRQPVGAGAGGD